jgi:hypothetical protein
VTQRLLLLARKPTGALQAVDMVSAISDTLGLLAFDALQRKITQTAELPDTATWVLGEASELRMLLINRWFNVGKAVERLGYRPLVAFAQAWPAAAREARGRQPADEARGQGIVAVHVEADPPDEMHGDIVGIALSTHTGVAWYAPLGARKQTTLDIDGPADRPSSFPLDEALVSVVVDLSGRPYLVYELDPGRERVGTFDAQG